MLPLHYASEVCWKTVDLLYFPICVSILRLKLNRQIERKREE